VKVSAGCNIFFFKTKYYYQGIRHNNGREATKKQANKLSKSLQTNKNQTSLYIESKQENYKQ
jgi:hypothetical protein